MKSGFKYSSFKHNSALLALGSIRIGTLHDFRRIEHGGGISDPNEGKKTVTHYISSVTSKDLSVDQGALKAFSFFDIAEEIDFSIEDVYLSQHFDHEDCFVHCLALENSSTAMSQLEGADSCVEVFDLERFYARLTNTLNMFVPVELPVIKSVSYAQRKSDWNGKDWGQHPAFIKDPVYSKQVELRALWKPKFSGGIKPIIMHDVELLRFCKMIASPS